MGTVTQEMQDAWMDEALRRTSFAHSRRVVCRKTSEEMSGESGKADVVFIDADHSYDACRNDMMLWWPKVKPGGIFCGHDYNENHPGVVKAVDEWFGDREWFVSVAEGSIWWTTKP